MYKQGKENTCVFVSMANCMAHCGKAELADVINGKALKLLRNGKPFDELIKLMRERGKEFSEPIVYSQMKFDPLTNQANLPTVAQLRANDGGVEQHAVTFFGNLIFEPTTMGKPMELNERNLNQCCGKGYSCVEHAVRFHNGEK